MTAITGFRRCAAPYKGAQPWKSPSNISAQSSSKSKPASTPSSAISPESGGFDEGMTPPEIFLASLGACAAYYAADYLRQKDLATEGTRVKVVADKVMNPPRIDNIRIEVELPQALEERHREGVDRAVHRCLIHNTLMNPPKIEIAVRAPALILNDCCWRRYADGYADLAGR